jgi:hypothetical protein
VPSLGVQGIATEVLEMKVKKCDLSALKSNAVAQDGCNYGIGMQSIDGKEGCCVSVVPFNDMC